MLLGRQPVGTPYRVPRGKERGGGSPGDRARQGIPRPTVGLGGSWGSTGPLLLRRTARHRGDVGQILPRVARVTSRSTAGGVPAPASPACLGGDFGLKLGRSRGARMAPGRCGCRGLRAVLGPGAAGTATERPWGQAAWHPGAQPPPVPAGPGPPSPVQRAGITPGGSRPHLHRGFLLGGGGASPKKPVPEGDRGRGLGPPPALRPRHLWVPTPQPPAPCTALSLSG